MHKSDDLSFHNIFIILLKNCVCCLCVSVFRGQKKVLDALELKLQAVWVLGTKLVLEEEQEVLLNA